MKNIMVLLAIPRTGSNNICSLINKSNNIEYNTEDFNGLLGIRFMKKNIKNYITKRISDENKVNNITNVFLRTYMQKYPEKYIKYLSEYKIRKFKLFKIFYKHLPLNNIIDIFFKKNKESKKIILKRDLIEVYVSNKIAERSGKWYNYDTSNIRIKINFIDFINFYNQWINYYKILEEHKDINTIIINYNNISGLSDIEQYNFLKNELIKINVKLDRKTNIKNFFKKQTKSALSKQIINYNDFIKLYNNYKYQNSLNI